MEDQNPQSAGHLLVTCARLLNEEALARTRVRTGAPRLRASHAALLPHLDQEGTRLTELAVRMGVTKQAVGQLVEEMEAMGVLTRTTDSEDGRAKRVRWSAKGRRASLQGQGALGEIEQELAVALGNKPMLTLQGLLGELLPVLKARATKSGGQRGGGQRGRRPRG